MSQPGLSKRSFDICKISVLGICSSFAFRCLIDEKVGESPSQGAGLGLDLHQVFDVHFQ
jgi:hypothetical protein